MAKKQTFGDKASKKQSGKNRVKLIKTVLNDKNSLTFSHEMVNVPEGKQPEGFLKDLVDKK
tara:strand:- start:382 stop:564 length:183 start_codon:yes stop_codon:yes gene_type:complete